MSTRPLPLPIVPTIQSTTIVTDPTGGGTTALVGSDTVVIGGATTNFYPAMLNLNTQETGPGVSSPGYGGLHISRGPTQPGAVFRWNETLGVVEAGLENNPQVVGTVPGATTPNKYLIWNGSGWVLPSNNYVNGLDQSVAAGSNPTFGSVSLESILVNSGATEYKFPETNNFANRVLTSDGSSQLYWANPTAIATASSIADPVNGLTRIDATAGLLSLQVSNVGVGTIDTTRTQLTNNLQLQGGALSMQPVVFNQITNNIGSTGSIFVYTGSTNATINLPQSSTAVGRMIVVINRTVHEVSIQPAPGDVFEGSALPAVLGGDQQYDSILTFSDGLGNWILV